MSKKKALIFSVLAIVGVVATAVTSAKAGAKAKDILEKETEKKGSELTKKEKAKTVAKVYAVPAGIAVGTAACVYISHSTHLKNEAMLASALAAGTAELKKHKDDIRKALTKTETEYVNNRKEKAEETVEEETEEASIKDAVDISRLGENCWTDVDFSKIYVNEGEIYHTGEGNTLFYDSETNQWFRSSEYAVSLARYHFNRNNILGYCPTLNEWCEQLQIPTVEGGDELGWPYDYLATEWESPWIDCWGTEKTNANGENFWVLYFDQDPVDTNYEP